MIERRRRVFFLFFVDVKYVCYCWKCFCFDFIVYCYVIICVICFWLFVLCDVLYLLFRVRERVVVGEFERRRVFVRECFDCVLWCCECVFWCLECVC